jgi:hypothetical protein
LSRQVSFLRTTSLGAVQPTVLVKVRLVVTITVVTLRLKSYNLVSELIPKGLEIGSMVHVLGIHVNKPDIARIEKR